MRRSVSEPRQLALRVVVLLNLARTMEKRAEDGSQDGREIEVALSYLTKHAGWTPSYDARYLRREDDLARKPQRGRRGTDGALLCRAGCPIQRAKTG